MTELKPCPFCGDIPTTNVRYWKCGGDELLLNVTVKSQCGVSRGISLQGNDVPFSEYEDAFATVIDMWNRRAANDQRR